MLIVSQKLLISPLAHLIGEQNVAAESNAAGLDVLSHADHAVLSHISQQLYATAIIFHAAASVCHAGNPIAY